VARIKLAYIGGGSTRAPGTMASLIHQGQNFQGSEVVLIDIDGSHLPLVKTLAEKMACHHGIDLTVSYTTDRRVGLQEASRVDQQVRRLELLDPVHEKRPLFREEERETRVTRDLGRIRLHLREIRPVRGVDREVRDDSPSKVSA